MKVLIFTNKQSRFDVSLQKLTQQIKRRGITMSLTSLNSRDGSAKAQLYDVYAAPAVVLTRDDGAPITSWRNTIPQIDDLSYQLGMV